MCCTIVRRAIASVDALNICSTFVFENGGATHFFLFLFTLQVQNQTSRRLHKRGACAACLPITPSAAQSQKRRPVDAMSRFYVSLAETEARMLHAHALFVTQVLPSFHGSCTFCHKQPSYPTAIILFMVHSICVPNRSSGRSEFSSSFHITAVPAVRSGPC